jgi:hypothetical protein
MPSTVGGKDFLGLGWGGGGVSFPCSQCVLNMIPCDSQKVPKVPQVVAEDVPNSTSDLSHALCPKYYNSHVYEFGNVGYRG